MDNEVKEKIDLLDQQIKDILDAYETLTEKETYSKSDDSWSPNTLEIEKDLFNRIDEIQSAKTRLITGEKLPEVVYQDREVIKKVPEIVYKDKEVEVIKYIDRDRKVVNIYKSGFAVAALYFVLLLNTLAGLTIYLEYVKVVFKW